MVSVLTTSPTVDPMEISDANLHLKTSGENDYINALIMTARGMMERYLNRSLVLQTWTGYANCWEREFCLDYPPLLAVNSVKYYNTAGVLTTLSTSDYWVDTVSQPGRVVLGYDFTPPELQQGRPNGIVIEYTAGYRATGTTAQKQAAIPEPIRHAMKILITDMYEHRGQYVIGNLTNKIPGYIIDLVHTYKIYN